MKMQFMCAFLLTTLVVSARCQYDEKERYIVLLKKVATDEQIEEVIQMVESSPREELFINSDNSLLPIYLITFLKKLQIRLVWLYVLYKDSYQSIKINTIWDRSNTT